MTSLKFVHDNMASFQLSTSAAGGVATPADAALMMQLGAEGVFVGSGIFKSGNPAEACSSYRKGCYKLQQSCCSCRAF